ncbi:MAG: Histidinol phosphate phosphatase HisJ family [Actinomycetia bacterium]|nr:Histidinol phosphate phosphatase HisJ family [Actinomycetes bacterium]
MGSNPIGPTDSGRAGYGTLPADKDVPADNHVHSQWSHDTGPRASMAAACARAVELGLPAVAFTEHLDFTDWGPGDPIAGTGITPNDKWGPRPLDISRYLSCLEECRQRYRSLRILSGVEAGEPHLFAGSAAAVLSSGRFDRVLGSVHTLPSGGRLVYARALLRREPAGALMRRYFAEVVAMIEGSDLFEVLAHLDYPRRYWPEAAGRYQEPDFEEEYRAVLRALASSGRVLELNTASPLVSVRLLRWWREEGGRALSFGSDAHLPGYVGERFREAASLAAAAGFRPGGDPFDFWRA